MSSICSARRFGWSVLTAAALVASLAGTASAQVVVTGAVDVTNQYSFRGIRQNSSEVSIWPYFDVGGATYKGDGDLKSVSVNVGMWNAFHTEISDFTNRDGELSSNKWYEADYYGTLGLGFGGGVTLGTTYTSYTSPGNYWAHIKEIAFKLSVDDSMALGKGALKPYGLIAFELDENGADGVGNRGTYIELGVAPSYAWSKASLAVPIKIGLSASDYYEFAGESDVFGYFSIAGTGTVPLGPHFNLHGGVEFQQYGGTLEDINEGYGIDDGHKVIGSIGLGFSF